MATLKQIKTRRDSVQSTKKITLAMKMVAGAKLRRAQNQVEAARPYAHLMSRMLKDLAKKVQALETPQPLLTGTGKSDTHLIIVATSDRGLCGSFNASIVRHVRKLIKDLLSKGQDVKILCIGRKGYDMLRMEHEGRIIEKLFGVGLPRLRFLHAQEITDLVIKRFEEGEFDQCTIVFNSFVSAMTQRVTEEKIIPLALHEDEQAETENTENLESIYEYEPSEEVILSELLPRNLAVQVYTALLENAASEQGSRMTAMDSASRNADEMIKKLSITYNRTRQAQITKELIEIISGAEAI